MSQLAKFLQETQTHVLELLSGHIDKYIYSNYDLSKISTSLRNDITKYLQNKAKYKNKQWLNIDFQTSELSLNTDILEFNFVKNDIPGYLMTILNESDKNTNFEILGSILFEVLLGSLTVEHRSQSRDGGIDFYGNFISQSCATNSESLTDFLDINSWYIGQAKYYKFENKIGTSYLRELIGTIELAKKNIWATAAGHNHFTSIKHYNHIVPIFLTSSYYSRDSYKIADEFNIKFFDSIDLFFWISILYNCNQDEFKTKFEYEKARSFKNPAP